MSNRDITDKVIIGIIALAIISIFIFKQKRETPAPEDLPVAQPLAEPVVSEKLPQLLDIGSTSCIPCKMMQPILEELTAEYKGQLVVKFIDVYVNTSITEKYNIQGIPTQIFLDAKGKEIARNTGFMPKDDILALWKSLGYEFKKNALPEKEDK
jgi:thioredoxin 1